MRTAQELATFLEEAVALTNGWTWSADDVNGLREAASMLRQQDEALTPFAEALRHAEFNATLLTGKFNAPDDAIVAPGLPLTFADFRRANAIVERS